LQARRVVTDSDPVMYVGQGSRGTDGEHGLMIRLTIGSPSRGKDER
jgi:hypothetical protein